MRFLVITVSLLLSSFCGFSQQKIKKNVFYPLSLNHKSLSHELTKKYDNDSLKVLAIYNWITHHIKYDYKRYQGRKVKAYSPNKTLLKRKGVCQHMSDLFQTLCTNAGINALQIPGYALSYQFYNETKRNISNHIWNTAYINGKWYLFEPTYGNGKLLSPHFKIRKFWYKYFRIKLFYIKYTKHKQTFNYAFVNPVNLIQENVPMDKTFQFTNKTLPFDIFIQGKDSIVNYVEQNDIQPSTPHLNYYTTLSPLNYDYTIATNAPEYNERNHGDQAIAAYRLALKFYKISKHKKFKHLSFSYQHRILDSLSKYTSISERSASRYSAESKLYKNDINRQNKIRYNGVAKRSGGYRGYYSGRYRQVKRLEKKHKRRSSLSLGGFYNLVKKNRRMTQSDLYRVVKKNKTDSATSTKRYIIYLNKADTINLKIDSIRRNLDQLIDSLHQGKSKLLKHHEHIQKQADTINYYFYKSIQQNSRLVSNPSILKTHDTLAPIHKQYKKDQKIRDKVYYKEIYPQIKQIRLLTKQITRLHNRKKKLLSQLKKTTSLNFNEDVLFRKENKELLRSLSYFEQSIRLLIDLSLYNGQLYRQQTQTLKELEYNAFFDKLYEINIFDYLADINSKEYNIMQRHALIIKTNCKNMKTHSKMCRNYLTQKEKEAILKE